MQALFDIELDTASSDLAVPSDLADGLDGDPAARRAFESLSYRRQRWYVGLIEGAESNRSRARRVAATLSLLRESR